jgi:hypothetical protein
MSKAKLPDGRRRNDYPHKIVVRLSDQQLNFMRERCGWLGNDQYVAYYLVVCGLEQRRIAFEHLRKSDQT